MSEGEKKKDEKKNTDQWKLKQEEKKKKKEVELAQPQKEATEVEGKKTEGKKEKTKAKKQEKIQAKQPEQPATIQPQPLPTLDPAITYKPLLRIDNKISQRQRQQSRSYQWQLVLKYLQQYVTKQDIILYIGQKQWSPLCQQVYISGFNNCHKAELVCRYSDITYFLESSVTKIFLQAQFIFANGSFLAKKGSLNLVLLAEYYNIPVVGCGGSWNYNGWTPLTESALVDHYGESVLADYDWIETKYLKSLILEVGSINPKQVSAYPSIIYKEISLHDVEW